MKDLVSYEILYFSPIPNGKTASEISHRHFHATYTILWEAHLVMAWTQVLLGLGDEATTGEQEVERESKMPQDNS